MSDVTAETHPTWRQAREEERDDALRREALTLAIKAAEASSRPFDFNHILKDAERFFEWLSYRKVTHLSLHVGDISKQDNNNEEIPVQLHDDEQITLTVTADDAKGFATTDNLTWTVDNGDVVSLQVADDTMSALVVAGNPGSAVLTLTDGNLTVTEAVDVVAAGAATISLQEGTVEKQGGDTTAPVTGA